MLEITNKKKHPVQLIVRTQREVPGSGTKNFTTWNIPGIGSNRNVITIPEERLNGCEKYLDNLKEMNWVKVNKVSNKIKSEGE